MISLFDYDDLEMRHCKDGDFWRNNSQRWNANNSAVWPERELTQAEVTRFVLDMVESGRGEPGIFNRKAAMKSGQSGDGRRPLARIHAVKFYCGRTSSVT
jgi:ribonucleoside-triphosphate reductase (thioredoxin)